jgi:hypothetical protein
MGNSSVWLVGALIVAVTISLTATQSGCSPFKHPRRFFEEAKRVALEVTIFVSFLMFLTHLMIKDLGSLS